MTSLLTEPRTDGEALSIWLITIGEPLPIQKGSRALRSRMLADELVRRGHQVTWWTSDFDHFSKAYFPHDPSADTLEIEGYRLRFLHGRSYRRNISLARQRNHLEIAADFAKMSRASQRPDVIVCSFPPIELAHEATRFGRENGVPTVLDVRDLWPDELVARLPGVFAPVGRFATSHMRNQVRRAAMDARSIVGVSGHYRDWGLALAGREATELDPVIPLGYPDTPASAAMRSARPARKEGPPQLLFSGSFNLSVDIATLIEALRSLPDLDIRVTLCGAGEMDATWRRQAAGDNRITFAGWVTSERIRELAEHSSAGLVCYRPASLVSMPNKLFEYLSFGLPVINSLPGEAEELVRNNGVGWNYRGGSPESLRDALLACSDAWARDAMPSRNAAQLYEDTYTPARIYGGFATLVERVAREG